jgi:hypothetical protein
MMKRFALIGLVLALLLPFDVSAQKGGEKLHFDHPLLFLAGLRNIWWSEEVPCLV